MTNAKETAEDLTVRPPSRLTVVLETALLCAAVPILGRLLHKEDPFFVSGPVSWPLFAPVLAGLRYGFFAGFGCAVSLVFLIIGAWRFEYLAVPVSPAQVSVALLLAGMVAGEFADMWMGRLRRLVSHSSYQRQRFDEFARSYHILKASHDKMEERSAGVGGTLRNALRTARLELLRSSESLGPLRGCGALMLDLFAVHGRVQIASILPVEDGELGRAAAALGDMSSETVASDPLVLRALATHMVASVDLNEGADPAAAGTSLLAAVPCVDVDDRLWAVVAIREMPFASFTPETLRLLALLGAQLADVLAFGADVEPEGALSVPTFQRHVRRCLVDARRHKLPASVVVFEAHEAGAVKKILPLLLRERRSLDEALLVHTANGRARLHMLLPLTDDTGAKAYLSRIDGVMQRSGTPMNGSGVSVVGSAPVDSTEGGELLQGLRGSSSTRQRVRHGASA